MDTKRVGRFTSSEIYNLTTNGRGNNPYGETFYSYIDEKYFEKRLGRRIDNECNAKPTSWGKLVEKIAFNELGLEYHLMSQITIEHQINELWSGTPDLLKRDEGLTVADIKCPFTLKSYCTFYDCNTIEDVITNHKDGKKYYWQLVSNSILLETKYAELIIYMPYHKDLDKIRDMAYNHDGDQNKIAWINWAKDEDLPYLPNNCSYNSMKIIRFEVSENDKLFLTNRVKDASEILKNKLNK